MERETGAATPSGTPTGLAREAHHVQFQGFIFEVQVFSDQQVLQALNADLYQLQRNYSFKDSRITAGYAEEHQL